MTESEDSGGQRPPTGDDASPIKVEETGPKITVRIEKCFKGSASSDAGRTKMTGELYNVHWDRYRHVVLGFQSLAEAVLGLSPGRLAAESELMEESTHLRAGFVIPLPRGLSQGERQSFDVAAFAFVQGLRDQDRELTADALKRLEPKMVDLGIAAADQVRRLVPGFTLPSPVQLVFGTEAKGIETGQKIGRHPDGEQDVGSKMLTGTVDAVDKSRNSIVVLGSVQEGIDAAGTEGAAKSTPANGRRAPKLKRTLIQFDPEQHDKRLLSEYLLEDAPVEVDATVKKRGKKEFLSIKNIRPIGAAT